VPFSSVAADEAYGQNTPLRDWLEERGVSYVLTVPKSFTAATAAGKMHADQLAALVPAAGWQQVSCAASPVHHLLVRRPVGGRGMLPGRQERDRPGPLPGPPLRRLVPARHPVDARARLPSGHRSSKGAPAPMDNFPGRARSMITTAKN
jgi:hypothetical protein